MTRFSNPMIRSIVREIWTLDACRGTHVGLVPEEPHAPRYIVCWDKPDGHRTFVAMDDIPAESDPYAWSQWMQGKIQTALRLHREPYNGALGAGLPDTSEAEYFGCA